MPPPGRFDLVFEIDPSRGLKPHLIHREAQEFQRMMHQHHDSAREAHDRHTRDHGAFDATNLPRPTMGWRRRRNFLDSLLTLELD